MSLLAASVRLKKTSQELEEAAVRRWGSGPGAPGIHIRTNADSDRRKNASQVEGVE